jgi:hypothetical protein
MAPGGRVGKGQYRSARNENKILVWASITGTKGADVPVTFQQSGLRWHPWNLAAPPRNG